MELRHQLTPHLTKLRLSGILQTLEARDRQAVDGHWSYIEFLARLLEDEVERLQGLGAVDRRPAQALLHESCRQGFDALFTTTHKMLQHINGGRADGTLERRLQTYLRPDVLVLDDFGLKPIQAPAPR